MFPVSPIKEQSLLDRMETLGIKEGDLEESFVRSQGKGGQHVNKTSTCVKLRHIPTGIEVKCQKSRSQSLNRYYARVMLLDKIEHLLKGKESAKAKEIERIRKQKLRRKRRSSSVQNVDVTRSAGASRSALQFVEAICIGHPLSCHG